MSTTVPEALRTNASNPFAHRLRTPPTPGRPSQQMDHVRFLRDAGHSVGGHPRSIFSKGLAGSFPHYLWDNPVDKGKEGGFWAPLIGTFYLVIGSLGLVAPVGILAGIYLNEYAQEGWINRVISITVTSLAGVPSIVHGLFGLGAFRAGDAASVQSAVRRPERRRYEMAGGLLTASLTVAVMNLPVIIASTREALAACPGFPRSLLEPGRQPLANDSHHRAAQLP